MSIVKNDIASIFLGQLARENPGEIYFLTCGPLTNLALTMKLFPDFTQNAKEIYVMGGNHHGKLKIIFKNTQLQTANI